MNIRQYAIKNCDDFYTLSCLESSCKDTDELIVINQRLVEIGEEIVLEMDDEIFDDPDFCHDIDLYAAPMDNLAVLYLEKKEYAKAVPLLERALQLYRIQEEFDSPLYLWQRYYALKRLVQCYTELGNKTMANICRYEQVLLERKFEMLTHDDASEETQNAVK